MGLEPYLLQRLAAKQMWDEMEVERIPDCIECGCCQYTCPAGIALLDYVRLGKQTVMGIIRARAAAAAAAKK
jgi:electron transport complex protein RnfC